MTAWRISVLLTVVSLLVAACGQASSPVEQQEQQEGVEEAPLRFFRFALVTVP
jgi:hypothetical protein